MCRCQTGHGVQMWPGQVTDLWPSLLSMDSLEYFWVKPAVVTTVEEDKERCRLLGQCGNVGFWPEFCLEAGGRGSCMLGQVGNRRGRCHFSTEDWTAPSGQSGKAKGVMDSHSSPTPAWLTEADSETLLEGPEVQEPRLQGLGAWSPRSWGRDQGSRRVADSS